MEGSTNHWSIASLKEYTDTLLATFSKGVDYRFESIKQAIEKSDAYAAYRDEKQNEFRKSLDDQNLTFARKLDLENLEKQFEVWMNGMRQVQEANFNVSSDSIRDVKRCIDKYENIKQGGNASWPWIVTIIMTLIAIISLTITLLK